MQREFCRERGRVDLTSHRSAELATSHPDLTRRANHRHSEIIAEIVKPAPDPAAGFLLFEFPQSDGGPHVRTPHLPNASSPVGRRPNQYRSRAVSMRDNSCRCARTRRHAAWRRCHGRRGPFAEWIGFAPEMIAPIAICRAFYFTQRGNR
jgi:hypothetical protein